ncbi:MAG: MBL fold metallo-hydrolase [Methanoregula sp.]
MTDPSITYFPVGNGDTSLIRLSNGQNILIDCNITNDSKDESDETTYNVHSHLQSIVKKEKEVPYIDAFILTHPDEDHCRGFGETFYTGDPSAFAEKHKKDGLIRIDELWFSPRIFSPHEKDMSETAKIIRKEATRRLKLYQGKKSEKNNSGNRLRIIGYTDNPDLKGAEEVITTPGNSINAINGSTLKDFSFFVHAPFKKDTDAKWAERNDTSVVLQARFDIEDEKDAARIFFGGDSGFEIWEDIVKRSKEATLKWDIFMAPHHCSWSFFNTTPYNEDDEPSKSSLELLNKRCSGAIIVASCKPIKNDDDNPPHFAAKQQYVKAVGKDNFIVMGEYPDSKQPQPLIFTMTKKGPQKMDLSFNKLNTTSAISSVLKTPATYG